MNIEGGNGLAHRESSMFPHVLLFSVKIFTSWFMIFLDILLYLAIYTRKNVYVCLQLSNGIIRLLWGSFSIIHSIHFYLEFSLVIKYQNIRLKFHFVS